MPAKQSKADNVFLLSLVKKLKPTEREKLVAHLNDDAIELLTESIHNIINIDVGISKTKLRNLRKNLQPSKKNLLAISNKSNSVLKRRRALAQEGGSLGLILSAAIPIITELISSFT